VGPYRDRCVALTNHAQSIEFTTGGLQSSCRNIKDDQWKQDAPELNFESHSKGFVYLCEKVYFYFYTFAKIYKILLLLYHYGYCV
jgi:hypothetical protein